LDHIALRRNGFDIDMRAEKRKSPRKFVKYPAWVEEGEDLLQPCLLSDVSQSGARLTVADSDKLSDEFVLRLSRDGSSRRKCRVVWREGRQVGVSFLKDPKVPRKGLPRPAR
jgi:hypothetical protein